MINRVIEKLSKLDSSYIHLNNTDYIETEINTKYSMNSTYQNTAIYNHSGHINHKSTKFNNDALRFQIIERLLN